MPFFERFCRGFDGCILEGRINVFMVPFLKGLQGDQTALQRFWKHSVGTATCL